MKKLFFLFSIIGFVRLSAQNDSINKVNAQGEKTGKWIDIYVMDGEQIKSLAFYKDGKQTGETRSYYDNDVLQAILHYDEKGEKDGISKFFYKQGTLNFVYVAEHGKIIYTAHYDGEGRMFLELYDGMNFHYTNGKCDMGDCKKLMGK